MKRHNDPSSRCRKSVSPAHPAGRDLGFSLLELMVVTTIVAALSVTAMLSLRSATRDAPAPRIEDFARAIRYHQAEALFTNRSFAIGFSETGWEMLVFSEAENTWQRRDPDGLHSIGDWGADNALDLQIEGRAVLVRPGFGVEPIADAFVLPSGETTPFAARLTDATGFGVRCIMQTFGELECQRSG